MAKFRRIFSVLIAVLLSAAFLSGCLPDTGEARENGAESGIYASFRDIPGVTHEDIQAIEKLLAANGSFSYGMSMSAEAFMDENGSISGFAALVCGWLSEMFGVPFIPVLYELGDLVAGLESGAIDFTGDIITTEESRKTYYMTDTIAERYAEKDVGDSRQLVFASVALSTQNPELRPVIDVVQKTLDDGTVRHLVKLYNQGHQEYIRHRFLALLSGEEREYIRNNPTIPIAAEVTNYPVSFYNSREARWQGIAIDVLDELEKLTGIQFEIINTPDDEWPDLLGALETGKAAIITELLYSEERTASYMWPDNKLFSSNYVLISKVEHHNVSVNEILYANIGLVKGTAHAALFRQWFPNHRYITEYEHNTAALDALARGEVDMMMSTQHRLLNLTNYLEQAGYKANYIFTVTYESTFGLNKDYAVLCSIVDKALGLIDTDGISGHWMRRTFDYRIKLEQQRTLWMIGAMALLFVFAFLTIILLRKRSTGRRLENLVHSRTEELEEAIAAAETANRTKTAFLASMSHEIRTPMNAIIGMLELLTHESLNESQLNYINDINHSATSLLSIINDILDMSKIEAGKMELMPVDYDFLAFLDNMHSMFTYVSEEKGLNFQLEIEGEAPHYLFGDDIRLRQVIINICGNAVKFTQKGSVRLKVTAKDDTLTFKVSDTGRGIKQEDIGSLFSAFQQTDTVKNREIGGTGLGLAISKSFVGMMGGSISVESEYGKGTIFTVTIPLIEGDGNKIKAAAPKGRKLFAPKAKILVVDDNEFNLRVAVGLLNLSKIAAETASSGYTALEMVQKTDYDIIFMDHMMPGMDGVETTEAIRAMGGKFELLTIVALTANAVQGAKEFFLTNGFNDFVPKPIDVRELITVLERWLPDNMLEDAPEAVEEADSGKTPGFLDRLKKIEEINVSIGLNGASGVESLYYEAVGLCCKHLPTECAHMSACLAGGDIGGFAILVHAMKSVLATIGAVGLSDIALTLEMASKGGDASTYEKLFPGFHDSLLALHDKLLEIFPEEKKAEKEPGDAAALKESVEKALAAAVEYDNDGGLAAVTPLLTFDFGSDVNALLETAVKMFEEFDCEQAGEALSKIKF